MADTKPKMEAVLVPRGSAAESPNLEIGINGTNYIIPRGVETMVPPEVAFEVRRHLKATEEMYVALENKAVKE